MTIIDGKAVSAAVKDEVKNEVEQLKKAVLSPALPLCLWETIPRPRYMSATRKGL